jgi:hypothetical protein
MFFLRITQLIKDCLAIIHADPTGQRVLYPGFGMVNAVQLKGQFTGMFIRQFGERRAPIRQNL